MAKRQSSTNDVTGRDGWIMSEALAFAYAAMRYLPIVHRPESNRADMRALLFAKASDAEWCLGQAMLTAWHLTHDDTRAAGRGQAQFLGNLSALRAEALLELNAALDQQDRDDLTIMIRQIDKFLAA